jgi:hypothetical protein
MVSWCFSAITSSRNGIDLLGKKEKLNSVRNYLKFL